MPESASVTFARIRLRDLRPNPIEPDPNGRIPKKHRGRAPQNDVRPYHLHASLLAFWLLFHLLAHVGSVQNNPQTTPAALLELE